jgi:TPR repeat protein
MLVNGRGGAQDAAVALKLCEQAAAKGHRGATFALGAMYSGSHDIPDNRPLAEQWFRAAPSSAMARRNLCSVATFG